MDKVGPSSSNLVKKEGNDDDPSHTTKTSTLLDIFTTPSPQIIHKRTGLSHSVLWRESSSRGNSTTKIILALQPPNSIKLPPILMAVKDFSRENVVYSIYSSSNSMIGQLVMVRKTMSHISYALLQNGTQVASILYKVPSILTFARDDPARSAAVAVASPSYVDNNPSWFKEACESRIRKTGSLDEEGLTDDKIAIFQSKNPYKKKDGRLGLNFHGRGREKSCKNMQLETSTGNVVCQLAKWDANKYNLDLNEPFSPFLAFGFALAQLDL
jgi:hypothetical protein